MPTFKLCGPPTLVAMGIAMVTTIAGVVWSPSNAGAIIGFGTLVVMALRQNGQISALGDTADLTHKIVNSQRTEMVDKIEDLKKRLLKEKEKDEDRP